MAYSSRNRDRFRLAVAALTGLTTAGSIAAVGWVTGLAARQHDAQQAERSAADAVADAKAQRQQVRYERAVARQKSAAYARVVVRRERPVRTQVTTRYVHAAPVVVIGGGSTVVSAPPATTHVSTPTHTTPPPTHTAPPPTHTTPPPPPPPPPPTTPSSGS